MDLGHILCNRRLFFIWRLEQAFLAKPSPSPDGVSYSVAILLIENPSYFRVYFCEHIKRYVTARNIYNCSDS